MDRMISNLAVEVSKTYDKLIVDMIKKHGYGIENNADSIKAFAENHKLEMRSIGMFPQKKEVFVDSEKIGTLIFDTKITKTGDNGSHKCVISIKEL